MNQATLCILTRENKICLGMKKRGFGQGKYNGFGGKKRPEESAEAAAQRELFEEIKAGAKAMTKVAEITYFFPEKSDWNQLVHIYLVTEWEGEPEEGEEMTVAWFSRDKIPYDQMWDNDKYWLPRILKGEKIRAQVTHDEQKTGNIEIESVAFF